MPLSLGSLKQRRVEPEWMDQPGLDRQLHAHALTGLRRINWISGSSNTLWHGLQRLSQGRPAGPLRVLDLACGGGDVILNVARRARQAGLDLELAGCDCSPVAIAHARQHAVEWGLQDVQFFEHHVLSEPLPTDYDVVTCSLFLHHLDDLDAQTLLSRMAAAARVGVLVQDLRRTAWGYWLAWLGCRLLSRSPIVHQDGPQSVKAAFTPHEVLQMATRNGLAGAQLSYHWPQRFLLQWSRASHRNGGAR